MGPVPRAHRARAAVTDGSAHPGQQTAARVRAPTAHAAPIVAAAAGARCHRERRTVPNVFSPDYKGKLGGRLHGA